MVYYYCPNYYNDFSRFIVLRGSSGFYWYAICEHLGSPEWPAFGLNVAMNAFVLTKEK